ncbi:MAG: 50S ribosomal protein L3 [Aigarchaeota archaeon]|nr:50S ribosomal protein L3 [Aigarchaeota archaeon]MDW8093136.1 50S ribosomal protein L3 [Nitrososphaerota archaeon]
MGRRKYSAPRHGSLAFAPRKRADGLLPSVKYWPAREGVGLEGFIAYKVGMSTVFYVDDVPGSPTQGSEVASACTVLATPPLHLIGAVFYREDGDRGLVEVGRIISDNLPEGLTDRVRGVNSNANRMKLEELVRDVSEVRALVASIPRYAGIERKRPFIAEIKVSGEVKEALDYVKTNLGKQIGVNDLIRAGQFVDVIGVTKGKGFQGVIARFGVKELPRKQRKTRRAIGAIGGRKPTYITRFVPRAGQMGFHRRVEFNKRVLAVYDGNNPPFPKGGWKHFGLIRSPSILLLGSVPGTPKRPLILRVPARPPRYTLKEPKVTAVTFGEEVIVAK